MSDVSEKSVLRIPGWGPVRITIDRRTRELWGQLTENQEAARTESDLPSWARSVEENSTHESVGPE